MNIIGLMETPITELKLNTKGTTTKVHNALIRNGINNILSIVYWKKEQGTYKDLNLDKKCHEELKQKLKEYGINIEDKNVCEFLINEYVKEKETTVYNIPRLLDVNLRIVRNRIPYDILERNGYYTFYDLIKNQDKIKRILIKTLDKKAKWNYFKIKLMLINFGIDIDQCQNLIEYFEKGKQQELQFLTGDNNKTENELTERKNKLKELKKELEKYNTMKEGMNHGTK